MNEECSHFPDIIRVSLAFVTILPSPLQVLGINHSIYDILWTSSTVNGDQFTEPSITLDLEASS